MHTVHATSSAEPRGVNRRVLVEGLLGAGMAALAMSGAWTSGLAQGTPAESAVARPNMFLLTGEGTEISFSTSSLTGQPIFTYTGPDAKARAEGDDIRIEEVLADGWPFGQLVSIYVDAAPDAWARSIMLVLPAINLIEGNETPFATFAVLTTHFTSIAGPALVQGPLQEYLVIPLEGNASAVVF